MRGCAPLLRPSVLGGGSRARRECTTTTGAAAAAVARRCARCAVVLRGPVPAVAASANWFSPRCAHRPRGRGEGGGSRRVTAMAPPTVCDAITPYTDTHAAASFPAAAALCRRRRSLRGTCVVYSATSESVPSARSLPIPWAASLGLRGTDDLVPGRCCRWWSQLCMLRTWMVTHGHLDGYREMGSAAAG